MEVGLLGPLQLAEGEVGLDPLLQADQAQLLEPRDLGLGEGLVAEVGEGRPPPQRQGGPQHPRRLPGGWLACSASTAC